MKYILQTQKTLHSEGRWDIDYHLPPEGILAFDKSLLKPVMEAADIVKEKRDPTKEADELFLYIDISCVDVATGVIANPQELIGSEAPSRARKIVNAYDLIISTCRPTRGAIAVVPEEYHNQICSTGFSVIRPRAGVNPFYLHFALRLSSTLEQFRKFSTGSSYPAILDSDVEKTLIPLPDLETQDLIAGNILNALRTRSRAINEANNLFSSSVDVVIQALSEKHYDTIDSYGGQDVYTTNQITERLLKLNGGTVFKLKS